MADVKSKEEKTVCLGGGYRGIGQFVLMISCRGHRVYNGVKSTGLVREVVRKVVRGRIKMKRKRFIN